MSFGQDAEDDGSLPAGKCSIHSLELIACDNEAIKFGIWGFPKENKNNAIIKPNIQMAYLKSLISTAIDDYVSHCELNQWEPDLPYVPMSEFQASVNEFMFNDMVEVDIHYFVKKGKDIAWSQPTLTTLNKFFLKGLAGKVLLDSTLIVDLRSKKRYCKEGQNEHLIMEVKKYGYRGALSRSNCPTFHSTSGDYDLYTTTSSDC